MFLLREIATFFSNSTGKICIGIKIDTTIPRPYNLASASCRIRAYDVIRSFYSSDIYHLEIYKPWKKYNAVIFLNRDKKNYSLAKKLKEKNVKIFLDVNANLFDESIFSKKIFTELDKNFQENFTLFCELADAIITPSPFLEKKASLLYNQKGVYIPEIISSVFFEKEKIFSSKEPLTLLYIGYALKAKQIEIIKDSLEKLALDYSLHYLFICEKDPQISFQNISTSFIPYNQKTINHDALKGDLFLAPRDLKDTYNLGHSFTKIGIPMALGIPVIASPLPSYEGSPAIIPENTLNWHDTIKELLLDKKRYTQISKAGIEYCKMHYSQKSVVTRYHKLFKIFL